MGNRSTGCEPDKVAPRLFGYKKGCFQFCQPIEVKVDRSRYKGQPIEVMVTSSHVQCIKCTNGG